MGSFMREYPIDQMTPLIHFQYDDLGATVRATEMKPKLDRFICAQYSKAHDGAPVPGKWLMENTPGDSGQHLNLKLQIHAVGESEVIEANEKIIRNGQPVRDRNGSPKTRPCFPMYFGNMGEGKGKNGVFTRGGLQLRIICKVSDGAARKALLDFIEENLELFFLTHNFGTRQTKGYGGFLCHPPKTVEQYLEMLSRSYPSFIYFRYKNQTGKKLADDVDLVCMAMKTGRNLRPQRDIEDNYVKGYLMTYPGLQGGNDKAMMKGVFQVGRTKKKERPAAIDPKAGEYTFKRALLGLTDNYEFRRTEDRYGNPIYGATISVKHNEQDEKKQIVRFPSPVLVKVLPTAVCFLPEDAGPILGKEFVFQGKRRRQVISTPAAFDTAQFLEKFAEWYNGKGYARTPNDTFIQGSLRDRCSKITLEVSKP